jgi:RNA polymerase-binding transcription factor DksA
MRTDNDEHLRAIRGRLLARKVELSERMHRVHEDLRRASVPLPRDSPDAAIVMENDEILQAVDEAARAELAHIQHAVQRLEAGTYGICETCRAKIDTERLRVVPYATACRRCAPEG